MRTDGTRQSRGVGGGGRRPPVQRNRRVNKTLTSRDPALNRGQRNERSPAKKKEKKRKKEKPVKTPRDNSCTPICFLSASPSIRMTFNKYVIVRVWYSINVFQAQS